MLAISRQNLIKELLQENKSVTIADLAVRMNVTRETIRRDLRAMEQEHELIRTHGGAYILDGVQNDLDISTRQVLKTEEKKAIALKCDALIQTGEIIYTPPVGEALLRDKLANWERFIHDARDIDPLIRMAVAHYQFEAIHPFTDGNGRTGRVLNLLMLVEQDLLDQPVLYLSRYIIERKADYYRLLLEVTRDGAWTEWVAYMLDAVADTARWTSAKIDAIRRLHEDACEWVRAQRPKVYTRELVDVLFSQPYCRIHNVVEAGIAKRETAARYLRELVDIGVLQEQRMGKEKLFLHPAYLRLLSDNTHAPQRYALPQPDFSNA